MKKQPAKIPILRIDSELNSNFPDRPENLKDAKTDLNHMETLHKNGQADKEAVEDSKANLAIAYLNLVLAEVKLGAAATKSAASAESLYTGFYADLRLSIEGTKTNSNTNSLTAVASNILSNGNLTISSGMSGPGLDASGDTTVTGSSLISEAGDINITSKGDTIINASKDTYNSIVQQNLVSLISHPSNLSQKIWLI